MKSKIRIIALTVVVLGIGATSALAGAEWIGTIKVSKFQDESKVYNQVNTTMLEAVETATKKITGLVRKAQLEKEDGYLVYSIEILSTDGKEHEVLIDPSTGAVLEVEKE